MHANATQTRSSSHLVCESVLICSLVSLIPLSSSLPCAQRTMANMLNSDTTPKTSDPEFDRSKANWTIMYNQLEDVRRQMEQYRSSMKSLCTSAHATVEALALLFPQSSTSTPLSVPGDSGVVIAMQREAHPYSGLAYSAKATLHRLVDERHEACDRRLANSCIAHCATLLDKFAVLKSRVASREELLDELAHYASKTASLHRDREKLLAQGRRETPKEEERRIRNEESMLRLKATFATLNSSLTEELTAYWDRRLDLITPMLLDFVTAQQRFAEELDEVAAAITHARNTALRTAPVIDFGTVLHEVTTCARPAAVTAAPSPPRVPRKFSSESRSTNSTASSVASSVASNGSTGSNANTRAEGSPTFAPIAHTATPANNAPPLPALPPPPYMAPMVPPAIPAPPTYAALNASAGAATVAAASSPSASLPPVVPARPSRRIIGSATLPAALPATPTSTPGSASLSPAQVSRPLPPLPTSAATPSQPAPPPPPPPLPTTAISALVASVSIVPVVSPLSSGLECHSPAPWPSSMSFVDMHRAAEAEMATRGIDVHAAQTKRRAAVNDTDTDTADTNTTNE